MKILFFVFIMTVASAPQFGGGGFGGEGFGGGSGGQGSGESGGQGSGGLTERFGGGWPCGSKSYYNIE